MGDKSAVFSSDESFLVINSDFVPSAAACDMRRKADPVLSALLGSEVFFSQIAERRRCGVDIMPLHKKTYSTDS